MGGAHPLSRLFAPDRLEQATEADIRAELAAHLEHATAERIAAGDAPEQALLSAREALGDIETLVRACARQKLGVRVMLQRIHLVATLALFASMLFFVVRSRELTSEIRELAAAARLLSDADAPGDAGVRPIQNEIHVELGDRIELVPTYNLELAQVVPVERDGTVLLPVVGHVMVAGLSRAELETVLAERYAPFYEHVLLHARVLRD